MKRFEHMLRALACRQRAVMIADEYGMDGWELVSVVPVDYRDSRRQSSGFMPSDDLVDLYFKREEASSPAAHGAVLHATSNAGPNSACALH